MYLNISEFSDKRECSSDNEDKSKKTVYDYPVLNEHLDTLRVMLKAYYKSHITVKMFKYELLK